jgi:hypothetical protein
VQRHINRGNITSLSCRYQLPLTLIAEFTRFGKMKLLKLIALITAMLAVVSPAHASTITYEIDAYLFGLDFDGGAVNEFQQGIGSATFEAPTPDGLALLIDFDIEILSATFTEQDDLNFPGAPLATIEDGVLVGIDFSGFNDTGAFLTVDQTFAFSVQWNPTGHIVSGGLGLSRSQHELEFQRQRAGTQR